MTDWLETHRTLSLTAAAVSTAVAVLLMWRGDRMLFYGFRHPDDPEQTAWIVRGFRRGIVAIGLFFMAGGFYWATGWPFIFAAVFLGEELFETGIMLAALHDQRKEEERAANGAGRKREV